MDVQPPDDSNNPYASSYEGPAHQVPPANQEIIGRGPSATSIWFGIGSAVVSVLGCGCCVVFSVIGLPLGITGVVLGRKELASINLGTMHASQRGLAITGIVVGAIGIGLSLLSIVGHGALIVMALLDNQNVQF